MIITSYSFIPSRGGLCGDSARIGEKGRDGVWGYSAGGRCMLQKGKMRIEKMMRNREDDE